VNVIPTRLSVPKNEAFIGEISAMLRELQPHCISRPKHLPVPVRVVTIKSTFFIPVHRKSHACEPCRSSQSTLDTAASLNVLS
jgi:hypothetical protein